MKLAASLIVIAIAAPATANPPAPEKADRKPAPPSATPPAPAPSAGAATRPSPPAPQTPAGPPVEVAALGKELAGTWTCKGVALRGDGSSKPLVASVVSKLDLDDAWLVTTLTEKDGKLKFTQYRSYNPIAKEWTRIQMDNMTGHVLSTSPGERGGKWAWTGNATSPMGTLPLRDYEQRDGAQLRLWGEAQIGGSWEKLYEVTCKK
jgi:hypothetical protein